VIDGLCVRCAVVEVDEMGDTGRVGERRHGQVELWRNSPGTDTGLAFQAVNFLV